jgi:hypothetical protein
MISSGKRRKVSKKAKRKRSAPEQSTHWITHEAALYAIRSAQEHDSYVAVEILDPFLAGDSPEQLLQAISKLHQVFRMDGGDRKLTFDADHFLRRAIAFDQAKPFRSVNSAIVQTLAAYAEEWDEKSRKADELLTSNSKNKWALQWKKRKAGRWEYGWKRARTHDDVKREWSRVRRHLRGFPKLFESWKRSLTNQARAIDSRKRKSGE